MRQFLLDRVLARQQPVYGRVQVVLTGLDHAELLRQGAGVPAPRGGQLGVGPHDTGSHHEQRPITLGTGLGGNQRGKAQRAHGQRHGMDVAVGA